MLTLARRVARGPGGPSHVHNGKKIHGWRRSQASRSTRPAERREKSPIAFGARKSEPGGVMTLRAVALHARREVLVNRECSLLTLPGSAEPAGDPNETRPLARTASLRGCYPVDAFSQQRSHLYHCVSRRRFSPTQSISLGTPEKCSPCPSGQRRPRKWPCANDQLRRRRRPFCGEVPPRRLPAKLSSLLKFCANKDSPPSEALFDLPRMKKSSSRVTARPSLPSLARPEIARCLGLSLMNVETCARRQRRMA